MSDASERRKLPRTPLDGWVEIAADGRRVRSMLRDISVGGLGIGSAQGSLASGARVVSEFPLPGISLPLEVSARVVWSDRASACAGLRFEELDPGLAELLARFVGGGLAE